MKVLLVSPKDPDKPGKLKFLVGGENTFTRTLLANPPTGVEYVHYQEALQKGWVKYTNFQKLFSLAMKARILPPDAGFQCLEIKDKFDLVHCHTYCLKLKNYTGPVVLSDSSANLLFLKDYLGWGQARIDMSYKLRNLMVKKFDTYDPNFNLQQAKKLIVWSNFAKKLHEDLGCQPKKIAVIPPGVARLPGKRIKTKNFHILFVGIWFERKGGRLLLKAYEILKKKYPQIKLDLIGQLPKGLSLSKGIWQKDYLPRGKLIKEVFFRSDVLVLVPPEVEGYGLVVLEAASLGIPAIVSSVCALAELVEDGKTGFVVKPGNVNQLVEKLELLIKNQNLKEKMGQAAKKRFTQKFWIKQTNQKLLRIYQEAIVPR